MREGAWERATLQRQLINAREETKAADADATDGHRRPPAGCSLPAMEWSDDRRPSLVPLEYRRELKSYRGAEARKDG